MLSISRTDPNRAATISLAPDAIRGSADMVNASVALGNQPESLLELDGGLHRPAQRRLRFRSGVRLLLR